MSIPILRDYVSGTGACLNFRHIKQLFKQDPGQSIAWAVCSAPDPWIGFWAESRQSSISSFDLKFSQC